MAGAGSQGGIQAMGRGRPGGKTYRLKTEGGAVSDDGDTVCMKQDGQEGAVTEEDASCSAESA